METIGRFTVKGIEVTLNPDDFFAPQLRNLVEVKAGEDLKNPSVRDNGSQSLPVLDYFMAGSKPLRELADGHDYVVICSRRVLRKFALLIDANIYFYPWKMQLERRVHNGTTIILLWMLESQDDSYNGYIIGCNLERLLISPPSPPLKEHAKRYLVRKSTLTLSKPTKSGDTKVPVYFSAEIDGFKGEKTVEIKAKKYLSPAPAFDTDVQNYFAGTELTVLGCHENGILETLKEYTHDQLEKLYGQCKNDKYRYLSLKAAEKKVETCFDMIFQDIMTGENQECNFFTITKEENAKRFAVQPAEAVDTIPPFPAWFLKE